MHIPKSSNSSGFEAPKRFRLGKPFGVTPSLARVASKPQRGGLKLVSNWLTHMDPGPKLREGRLACDQASVEGGNDLLGGGSQRGRSVCCSGRWAKEVMIPKQGLLSKVCGECRPLATLAPPGYALIDVSTILQALPAAQCFDYFHLLLCRCGPTVPTPYRPVSTQRFFERRGALTGGHSRGCHDLDGTHLRSLRG